MEKSIEKFEDEENLEYGAYENEFESLFDEVSEDDNESEDQDDEENYNFYDETDDPIERFLDRCGFIYTDLPHLKKVVSRLMKSPDMIQEYLEYKNSPNKNDDNFPKEVIDYYKTLGISPAPDWLWVYPICFANLKEELSDSDVIPQEVHGKIGVYDMRKNATEILIQGKKGCYQWADGKKYEILPCQQSDVDKKLKGGPEKRKKKERIYVSKRRKTRNPETLLAS